MNEAVVHLFHVYMYCFCRHLKITIIGCWTTKKQILMIAIDGGDENIGEVVSMA
jgi:hypothetical protein